MNNLTIRMARYADLEMAAEIESICFPAAEAASREALGDRIATFPDGFLVAELDGHLVGFIDGAATNRAAIEDEMFKSMKHHVADGENLAIYGLNVIPEYRRQGVAARLILSFIEAAEKSGRKKILLTCKENMINYYRGFGFVNDGISASSHGAAKWFDMSKELETLNDACI